MNWIKTEIYIAVGDEHMVLPAFEWKQFLDEVVTPRFQKGITITAGIGQWHNSILGRPQHLEVKVLTILHDGSKSIAADEIRSEWKKRYSCESVMRVDAEVKVSF